MKDQDSAKGECDPEKRDGEEMEWFEDSNFKKLPSVSRGASRLSDRLSKMLFNQTRNQLLSLMADIDLENENCLYRSEGLGRARVTLEEQRT